MEIKDTLELSVSDNYEDRVKAEYYQIQIRLLKLLDTMFESAKQIQDEVDEGKKNYIIKRIDLFFDQFSAMVKYMQALKERMKFDSIANEVFTDGTDQTESISKKLDEVEELIGKIVWQNY